jgi:hypothetical protein
MMNNVTIIGFIDEGQYAANTAPGGDEYMRFSIDCVDGTADLQEILEALKALNPKDTLRFSVLFNTYNY